MLAALQDIMTVEVNIQASSEITGLCLTGFVKSMYVHCPK